MFNVERFLNETKVRRAMRLANEMPDDQIHTLEFYENGGFVFPDLSKSEYALIDTWMASTENTWAEGPWVLPKLSKSDKAQIAIWTNRKSVPKLWAFEKLMNLTSEWYDDYCSDLLIYKLRVSLGEMNPWYQPALAYAKSIKIWK